MGVKCTHNKIHDFNDPENSNKYMQYCNQPSCDREHFRHPDKCPHTFCSQSCLRPRKPQISAVSMLPFPVISRRRDRAVLVCRVWLPPVAHPFRWSSHSVIAPFCCGIAFHHVDTRQLVYPFTRRWTFRVVLALGCYEQNCYELAHTHLCPDTFSPLKQVHDRGIAE